MGVARGEQRAPVVLDDLDVGQRADEPVVPPGHHLEHHRVVAFGEHLEDRLAGRDDAVDLAGADVRVVGQRVELGADLGLHLAALGRDQGRVEGLEPHLAGEVTDQRMAQLRRGHEMVEDVTVGTARAVVLTAERRLGAGRDAG